MADNIALLERNSDLHYQLEEIFQSLGRGSKPIFSFDYTETQRSLVLQLSEEYLKCSKLLEDSGLHSSKLILLKGDGSQDGHALRVKGGAVTFLDLSVYMGHLKNSDFDRYSHLLHEMIHGAHYHMNSAVSPLSLLEQQDRLGTQSIIEGVCVYIAKRLNPLVDNYWFNYLGDVKLMEWKESCLDHYENDLNAIKSGQYSKEQTVNLIGCQSFKINDLVAGRRSYYCISKSLERSDLAPSGLMALTVDEIRDLI